MFRNSTNTPRLARTFTRTLIAALALLSSAAMTFAAPELFVQEIDPFEQVFDSDLVHFGNVVQGESESKQFILINSGDANLTIQSLAVLGQQSFDWNAVPIGGVSLPRVLAPGNSMNILVEFAPPTFHNPPGSAAIVQIDTNAPDAPFQFQVGGTVLEEALVPAMQLEFDGQTVPHNGTINLGDLIAGETLEIELFANSIGPVTLRLLATNVNGTNAADFDVIDGGNTQVPSGDFDDLLLELTPSATGPLSAILLVTNDSLQNPYIVNLIAKVYDDCNFNGVVDVADIADGTSFDCDEDGIPDECEDDTDGDDIVDDCDVCPGQDDLLDTDGDGTPDCLEQQNNDGGNNNDGGQNNDGGNDGNDGGQNNDGGNNNDGGDITPVPVGACGTGSNLMAMAMFAGFCGLGMRRRKTVRRIR